MPTTSLKQGFLQLVYFTWLHNADALAFAVIAAVAFWLLLARPKRVYVLWLLGALCLLVRFEYLKHVVGPLSDQTVSVVIQSDGYAGARRNFDLFFYHAVPLTLYLAGWGSWVLGMFLVKDERSLSWTKALRLGRSKKIDKPAS